MIDRKAFVLACDDLHQSINGKITLTNIYTQDIVISGQELTASQLVFFFIVEGPLDDPFEEITLKIVLPGEQERKLQIPFTPISKGTDPRRNRMVMKWPILIPHPILRPGRIETIVLHEKGEIDAGGIWIVSPDSVSES